MAPSLRTALLTLILFTGTALAAPAPAPAPTEACATTPPPPPVFFLACKPDRVYCGWSLVKNLGWPADSVAPQALYNCTEGGLQAVHVKVCGKGCAGPSAHCAE